VRRLKEVQERPKAYGLEDLMVDNISRPFIPEYGLENHTNVDRYSRSLRFVDSLISRRLTKYRSAIITSK